MSESIRMLSLGEHESGSSPEALAGEEEYTSDEDEPSLIDDFVDVKSVKVWARNVSKEDEVVKILNEFLETLSDNSQQKALQHFEKVKKVFENHLFIRILSKVGCCTYMRELYLRFAGGDLAEFLYLKMRRDPTFRKIFESDVPVKLMRSALSILVGYWSNRNLLSLLVCSTGNSVLFGGEEEIPVATNTIPEVFEDETMNELAEPLSKVPKAVTLAKEFLKSIQKEPPVENIKERNYWHKRQFDAACRFWYDPVIVAEIIKALNEPTGLLNSFKKYSRRAQLWRCEERMARIKRDPSLRTILEGDQALQIRGALSILIGYWNAKDVVEVFSSFHSLKSTAPTLDLSEGDVEVFEYLIRWRDDFEALKNVLADKYPRHSRAFFNRFDEIWGYQQSQALPEVFDSCLGYITVVLKNGRVIHFQMDPMPCVDKKQAKKFPK